MKKLSFQLRRLSAACLVLFALAPTAATPQGPVYEAPALLNKDKVHYTGKSDPEVRTGQELAPDGTQTREDNLESGDLVLVTWLGGFTPGSKYFVGLRDSIALTATPTPTHKL